jgi:TatD DNase family protein
MLVDSHCHLDFPDFSDDLVGVVERAGRAGVDRMVTISTRVGAFAQVAAVAERFSNIFCTVGTHPHQAGDEPDVPVADIVRLSKHPKCVAIGEAGLDYHYDKAPRAVAQAVFRTHVEAARQSGLPLVIHSRDADEDMAAILRDEMRKAPFSAILHCFTSTRMLAETGLELGLYVSFSGVVTFRNSEALRDIARHVPLDRILVETDAPFLAPVPHRGKRNEPAFVAETARVVAELKGLDLPNFARITTENVERVFSRIPKRTAAAA